MFGGLISSTLLDTLLTPLAYNRFGRRATERLLLDSGPATSPRTVEAY